MFIAGVVILRERRNPKLTDTSASLGSLHIHVHLAEGDGHSCVPLEQLSFPVGASEESVSVSDADFHLFGVRSYFLGAGVLLGLFILGGRGALGALLIGGLIGLGVLLFAVCFERRISVIPIDGVDGNTGVGAVGAKSDGIGVFITDVQTDEIYPATTVELFHLFADGAVGLHITI